MDIELRRKIRETYEFIMPLLVEGKFKFGPYIFDFHIPLTPIEENVWDDIRYLGLPFYMQFPAGPYFIDFADPVKKIGIEVDGKEWHKDLEKDQMREDILIKMGWTIYRIPGWMTFKKHEDFFPIGYFYDEYCEDDYESRMREYYTVSSEGILERIKEKHYSPTPVEKAPRIVHINETMKYVMEYVHWAHRRINELHQTRATTGG